MEIYGIFAQVYDKFMQAPYEDWADFIEGLWEKHTTNSAKPNLVLDLACGTGSMSQILAARGYETIGIDASAEMLAVAHQKDNATLYLLQDMRSFELYGSVDAIICLCDSLNYILDYDELMKVFALCANYLNPGGMLIFDINTEYKYSKILANNNFSHTEEDAAYIWENFYDEDERLNEYQATFFIQQKNGFFARHEELHVQKAYSYLEIEQALSQAGLAFIASYDEESKASPTPGSERVFFVAKRGGDRTELPH